MNQVKVSYLQVSTLQRGGASLIEPVDRVVFFATHPNQIKLQHYQRVLDCINQLPKWKQYALRWLDIEKVDERRRAANYTFEGCNQSQRLELISALAAAVGIGCFELQAYPLVDEDGLETTGYRYTPNTVPFDMSGLLGYLQSEDLDELEQQQAISSLFYQWLALFYNELINPISEVVYLKKSPQISGSFEVKTDTQHRFFYLSKSTVLGNWAKLLKDETKDYKALFGQISYYEASHALESYESGSTADKTKAPVYSLTTIGMLSALAIEYNPKDKKTIPRPLTGQDATNYKQDLEQLFKHLNLEVAYQVGFFLISLQQQQKKHSKTTLNPRASQPHQTRKSQKGKP